MQKKTPMERPPYAITSVDNVLRLLQLLRDMGALRLREAAVELDVAPSTAHRLLSMLVYRGFAVQDEHRRYVPGPALGERAISASWIPSLISHARDPVGLLCSQLDETVNLMIRVGVNARFLFSVEATTPLRVGDRSGTVLPALSVSGGKALLATQPRELLEQLYRSKAAAAAGHYLDDREFGRLCFDLAEIRSAGHAVNMGDTEEGIAAVGIAVLDPRGVPVAAVSVAAPIARITRVLEPSRLALVHACGAQITQNLADAGFVP